MEVVFTYPLGDLDDTIGGRGMEWDIDEYL